MNRNNWLFGLTILTISSIIKSKSILDEDFENLEKIKNEELETELDFLEALKNSSVQDNDRLIKFKSFLADEFMKISKDISKFDFDEEAIITTTAAPMTQTDEEAIVTTTEAAPTTPTDKFDYNNVEIKLYDSNLTYTVKEDKIEFVKTGNDVRTALFNLNCNEYIVQLVKIPDPGYIYIGYADENYPLNYNLGQTATSMAYSTFHSSSYSGGYSSSFRYNYGTFKNTETYNHMKMGDNVRVSKQDKSLKYYINDLLVQEHTIQTDVELKPAVTVYYSGTEFNIQFLC